jgi:hypothetical protein
MKHAKKTGSKIMLKSIAWLLVILALGTCGYWTYRHVPEVAIMTEELLQQDRPILTFEVNYPPESLIQKHQKELVRDTARSLEESYIAFIPHLLMNVKYLRDDKKTEAAQLLWNLHSGEMVLDTGTFETTRGFEDCLQAQASEDDFRILHAILRRGGTASREMLLQDCGGDFEQLTNKLESLKKRQLIAIRQELIRLHFQTPFLQVKPQTIIRHALVVRNSSDNTTKARYSKDQVHKISKAAFGPDLAIQSDQLVYLPCVVLEIRNPDNSTLKTYWNGVTGKSMADSANLLSTTLPTQIKGSRDTKSL